VAWVGAVMAAGAFTQVVAQNRDRTAYPPPGDLVEQAPAELAGQPVTRAGGLATGDGFKLKRDILNYSKDAFEHFGEKATILAQIATRKELDPYRLLSAHIHAQSAYVVPDVHSLKDVIYSRKTAEECISLQRDVAEYLSDQLFATGLAHHASLPTGIVDSIKARGPTIAQLASLFK
jgi:hypothetical protein